MPTHYLIFGGTFDPPTLAHEALIRALQGEFKFDKVLVIPTKDPVPSSEKKPQASAIRRIEMLTLAFAADPWVTISHLEVDRGGFSYTIDTLRDLRKTLCEGDTMTLLIGADNYQTLHTWKDLKEIFTLCSAIVMYRPGYDMEPEKGSALQKALDAEKIHSIRRDELLARALGGLYFFNAGTYDVSSSKVRQTIMNGLPEQAQSLLNPLVWDYIQKTHEGESPLYRHDIGLSFLKI